MIDPAAASAARRILAACASGSITLAEMVTLFRMLGLERVPLHRLLGED